MNYSIKTIEPFSKQLKRLIKKYPSLKEELAKLGASLILDPSQGTQLGNNCYKIRLSIKSKGKGKSGGARVITHLYLSDNIIYLISIYDKSEQANIKDADILDLLKFIY